MFQSVQKYVYDNVYRVWCPFCRRNVEVKDPKTLEFPMCPKCTIGKCEPQR